MFATIIVLSLPSGIFSSVILSQNVLMKNKRKEEKERFKVRESLPFPLQMMIGHAIFLTLYAPYRHFP
ncbi:hypothetical protein BDV36DRAFT_277513 [Aspergillus pseudocaelatus]|uniref:Uncharacterized protein n=1 Tax=Aspergillus pseudocaelatus TaxID=1825620 RepID=A0ABQ6W075_9EURO|nr:hypothetical protein BDV36DRAFT_277513 [Aspergillus pseudocaelatus]